MFAIRAHGRKILTVDNGIAHIVRIAGTDTAKNNYDLRSLASYEAL